MARIRSVKPEFWTDGIMVGLTAWARLFYIGSWNFACDGGHLADDPMSLKLRILPADPVDVAELVAELVAAGRLERRKTASGQPYLRIRTFADHQKLDPRWKSKCPYCLDEGTAEPPQGRRTTPETHSDSRESRRDSPTLPDSPPRSGVDRSGVDREVPAPVAALQPQDEPPAEPPDEEPITGELIDDIPGTALVPTTAKITPADTNAGQITKAWIDHCTAAGVKLPKNLIGRYAKAIKTALDQGFHPNLVKNALANMLADSEASRPHLFDSYLVKAQQGPPRRQRQQTPGEDSASRLLQHAHGQSAEVIQLFGEIVRTA